MGPITPSTFTTSNFIYFVVNGILRHIDKECIISCVVILTKSIHYLSMAGITKKIVEDELSTSLVAVKISDKNSYMMSDDISVKMDSGDNNHNKPDPDKMVCKSIEETSEFYGKAQKYWSKIPATVNGMLGGLGYISTMDIQGSSVFLRDIKLTGKNFALDCGAGIGRISRHLLMPMFNTVDLVEQDPAFARKAMEYCTVNDSIVPCYSKRLGQIFNVGLQNFTPTNHKYDLIWCQWVLGHLTDVDLMTFFQRIKDGLAPKGFFVIKENITTSLSIQKDDVDSSLTRPLRIYEKLLKQVGFKIVRSVRQKNFPKGLYPVFMIACKTV